MVKPWMFLFLLVCFYSVQADDAGAGSNNTIPSDIETSEDATQEWEVSEDGSTEDIDDILADTLISEPTQDKKSKLNQTNSLSISKPVKNSSKSNETSSSLDSLKGHSTNKAPMLTTPSPINPPSKSVKNVTVKPRPYIKENEAPIVHILSNAKNLGKKTEQSSNGDSKALTQVGSPIPKLPKYITKNNKINNEDGEEDLKKGESSKTKKSKRTRKTNKLINTLTGDSSKKRRQKRRKTLSSYLKQHDNPKFWKSLLMYLTRNANQRQHSNQDYSRQYPKPPRYGTSRGIDLRPLPRYETRYPWNNQYPQGIEDEFNPYYSRQFPGYETSRGIDLRPVSRYENQYPWNNQYPQGIEDEFNPYYSRQFPRYETSRGIDLRPVSRYENQYPWNIKYAQGFENEFDPYSSREYPIIPRYETSNDLYYRPPFMYETPQDIYYSPSSRYENQGPMNY